MRFLTIDEFNAVEFPPGISKDVVEACRYIFIQDTHLYTAAYICGIYNREGMLQLISAMEYLIKQMVD